MKRKVIPFFVGWQRCAELRAEEIFGFSGQFCFSNGNTMRPEMITQIIGKQFFCVTDVCLIGKFIPREFFCVIGVYRKYHMEAPKLHKRIPARKLCVTDVLCN